MLRYSLLRVILTATIIFIFSNDCYPREIIFTVLEKTRSSNLVVLAKCVGIEDEEYSIEYSFFPGKPCTGIRYGRYEILEIWKGELTEKTIRIDYKITNEKYPPLGECIIMYPRDGKLNFNPEPNETVILFIEPDYSLYLGDKGKIRADESEIALYREAARQAVELDSLEDDKRMDFLFDHLEDDNKYARDGIQKEFRRSRKKKYNLRIARLLYSENEAIKLLALSTLNGTGDSSVVSFVIPLLADTSVWIRRTAADVLRRIRDERTIPALMESFDDPDPIVRRNIIFALSNKYLNRSAEYRDKAILIFCRAAKDTSFYVRGMGVFALDTMSDQRVNECLLGALNDDSSDVRYAALGALSSRGIESIVEPVRTLFCQGGPETTEISLVCVERLVERGLIDRENYTDIIRKLWDIVSDDSSEFDRANAVRTLAKIKDTRLFEMLPDLLNDNDYSVQISAADIMWQSRDQKYIPILREALTRTENENIISHIKYSIKKLETQ